MCKHGNTKIINLSKPTTRGFTYAGVDECIAPLIQAINDAGYQTLASCCGHGHLPISIALEDGKWLMIFPDDESFHKALNGFDVNIHGEKTR